MKLLFILSLFLSSFLASSQSFATSKFESLPFDLKHLIFENLLVMNEPTLKNLSKCSKSLRDDIHRYHYFPDTVQIESYEQLDHLNQTSRKFPVKLFNVQFTSPDLSKAEILRCLNHSSMNYVETVDFSRVTTLSARDRAELENLFLRPFSEDATGTDFRAFSPDGSKALISSRFIGTAYILDVKTGQILQLLKTQMEGMDFGAFSPNGSQVITLSSGRIITLWDVRTGRRVLTLGHPLREPYGKIQFAGFSPDGLRFATSATDFTTRIWNAETGEQEVFLTGKIHGFDPAPFSPDGSRIVTVTSSHDAKVWDIETGELLEVLKSDGQLGPIQSAKFSPDGRRILTTETGVDSSDAMNQYPFLVPSFLPPSLRSVPAIWDAETGSLLHPLRVFSGRIQVASFSPDGSQIITGSSHGVVSLWDTETGMLLREFNDLRSGIKSVAFFPDGKKIIAVSIDDDAFVWNLETGMLIREQVSRNEIPSNAISPDGKKVLISDRHGSVKLWRLLAGF